MKPSPCRRAADSTDRGIPASASRSVNATDVYWADSIGGRNTGLVKRV